MESALVLLHYGGKWTEDREYIDYEVVGITVTFGCTYTGFVDTIYSALELDRTRVNITIHYKLKKELPLVKFFNNSSVLFYMELKKKNQEIDCYPLIIDITMLAESITSETSQNIQPLSANMQIEGSRELDCAEIESTITQSRKSIEEISLEVYEQIPQFEEENSEVQDIVTYDASIDSIMNNQIFQDKELLKTCIAKYAMRNMFQYKVKRSDNKEYVLICVVDSCQWTLRASKVGKTNTFKIRCIRNDHTCSLDVVLGDHRQASSSTVASCIKHNLVLKTNYTPRDIRKEMQNEYGVTMSYDKAWRAREKAYVLLKGHPGESYQRLPTYLHMLQVANPGTVTSMEIDSNDKFKYLFMALMASIEGWEYCRPVMVVDGTYLKGTYGGTLFTACTQDANNNIFVLGFGIGDNENNDSWEWFLSRIKETFGIRQGLCIVSDRHPSIDVAVEKVYPNVMHGACSFHLLKNLKTTFSKNSKDLVQPFNAAARAYTKHEFDYHMSHLDKINEEIRGYLEKAGYEKWTRSHMTTNRYSIMTSNIVESVNSATRTAKKEHIETLLECLRYMLQRWFSKNRDKAMGTFTTLATNQEKLLREKFNISRRMKVIPSTPVLFQVDSKGNTKSNIVNIQERTCTCNRFQIDKMPCAHAVAVLASKNFSPYDYCSRYYTKTYHVQTYNGIILPIGDRTNWIVPEDVKLRNVLPPIPSRKPGRPKEKRYKSEGEPKVARKCGRCKEYGHTQNVCKRPEPLPPKSRKKRKTTN